MTASSTVASSTHGNPIALSCNDWSYVSPMFHLLPFVAGRLFGRYPARGDVVILTPPDAARRGEDLIKRVVGLPGDTVQMVHDRM